jgi:hypothetical protein
MGAENEQIKVIVNTRDQMIGLRHMIRLIGRPRRYAFAYRSSYPVFSRVSLIASEPKRSRRALNGSEVFAMLRMDHFHGKLFGADDESVLLEQAEGYIACHDVAAGRKSWFGHIELPVEKRSSVSPGVRYRLVLDDGRYAYIYADVHEGSRAGEFVAEFQVTGGFVVARSLRAS